ncbi:hypothetical protein [Pontibacter anaerobius]|uniref:Uncharacterized protein n=1 Tax=Pontibacter anaerobius TaxID=2993940 RepID=A0ABT3RGL7_9BACT|nr:hypothetical protein [Pontibacter anaerobius]MCX2740915.1 hypothetical protein [Pontibacter anaerobius]
MRWTLLLLLLLCSCATQRQAEKYFDENTDKLAAYVDKNEAYTNTYGEAYATRHFPPRLYPPAIEPKPVLSPGRLLPTPMMVPKADVATRYRRCPECNSTSVTKTVYLPDTVQLDSLHRELKIERMANTAIRQKLKETEADRDYWQEMNRKKRWALIAMAVFAVLYILFKVLAARVRTT